MKLSDFDYELPGERIAQAPLARRDDSRLMVLPRLPVTDPPSHRRFRDLPGLLRAGDLLVFNDTRVFPARLQGRKATSGGKVEALLLESLGEGRWRALCGSSKPLRPGGELLFAEGRGEPIRAWIEEAEGEGVQRLRFELPDEALLARLEAGAGEVPLPPYIQREEDDAAAGADRERYQTIFARERGAVAAPTAGLHFTEETFAALAAAGTERTFITLHVGPGTFLPVRGESVAGHKMHEESYEIGEAAAGAIAACKARGGRVISVGTTSLRALEAAASAAGELAVGPGRTELFVTPGFGFRVVDGLLTNFHLPRSTLLMLVAALAGRERLLAAYREAIDEGYRFYSYGDAMLLV
ncbi:MAG: tRNA preQ1(34) S-adenosylmethionine ribosyltransferase-isomerase QueA [Deltaproteobacteria bacterium]|nr:tRNA preQ1(34) S-adenosylmethionine ribosyltransferase-isomerase QueA [Deltaproteobacteria bacterium]